MTREPPRDPAASIRQRLLNHAKAHKDDYQRVLTRYAIERLLFRLGRTDAGDRYILKGAMLFATWPEQVFRPTGDLDLLGQNDSDPAVIAELFALICRIDLPADGISFDPAALQVETVREEGKYQGVRLSLKGRLGTAIIPVRVDIGFGDKVHPAPTRRAFPTLLPGLPAAEILMYPPETVVAEKFEAMVRFGEANTRIKDFYDIWVVARIFAFDLATLVVAIEGTPRRRETAVPTKMPVALTKEFAGMADKQALWSGFKRRAPPTLSPPPLGDLLAELRQFFQPLLVSLASPERADRRWDPHRGVWE